MSDTAAPIGETGPSVAWRTLHLVLTPAPGRLRNTLILVTGVVVIVLVWEVFRIPDAATACYVVLFISRDERTSTMASAKGIAILGPIAVALSIVATMASLSDPALRFAIMTAMTFGAMFLSRAARTGTPYFALGFVMVYAMTASDSVLRLALQPVTASNTTDGSLPALLFQPPEETLLHTLLWLTLSVVVPAVLVLVLNKAFGRDPAVILRRGIGERLAACAAFLEDTAGAAERLEALARRGSPELLTLAGLAEKDHGPQAEPADANRAAIRATSRLMLACLAFEQTRPREARPDWMAQAAERCRALQDGDAAPPSATVDADGDEIGTEIHRALDEISAARRDRAAVAAAEGGKPKPGFWADDAFSAANLQFGLKITLSVMVCDTLNNALDWPGIGTSVVTCFFVALGTLGESGHKMTLRITGCLIGAALAVGSIVLLMPLMTEIQELLALIAAGTFVGGWIACGSERISYAGWQIALAFFTVVLQGFGPVTDMSAAKDRIVGILIGNVVSYLVLATIWPVRVDRLVASSLADGLTALGDLLHRSRRPDQDPDQDQDADRDAVRERFMVAVSKAQSLMMDELYEGTVPGEIHVDERLAGQIQSLILPVSMIAAGDHAAYAERLASWFRDIAAKLRDGEMMQDSFPSPPASGEPEPTIGVALLADYLDALPFHSGGVAAPSPATPQR